jgi:hypothetical protein
MTTSRVSAALFFALGLYFIFQGFTADYFVDESEGPTNNEQKERWKATPLLRGLFICVGAGIAIWSLFRIIGKA